MIRFRTETTENVINAVDSNGDVQDEDRVTFKQGEEIDADIYNDNGDDVDIQFANGSVINGLSKDIIEVM